MNVELFNIISDYPFVSDGIFFDSKKLPQNKTCLGKCKEKDCLTAFDNDIKQYRCSKGFDNFKIPILKRNIFLNGLILKSNHSLPESRRDARRNWIIVEEDVIDFLLKVKNIDNHIQKDNDNVKVDNLSMFHDFKSSMNIFFDCTQNIINTLPGTTFEEKLNFSDKSFKDLYNALELITSQLGMIDIISNPKSISFGNKREISIYKLFDKLRLLFENHRVARKKNVTIEILNKNDRYVANSMCFETIEFIPLILLDNALKYSSPYSTISIEFYQYHKTLKLKIKNIGPFIDDSSIDKIFDKFYRGKTGEEFTNQGLGVGLWIAQEILKEHNSELLYYKDLKATGNIGLNIFEFDLVTL